MPPSESRPDKRQADQRPDPDALLREAAREGRGHLRVFLGAAPGVGKTWEMLNAARRRVAEGTDVLVGVVETHGRAETEAQIGDLPVLPRRPVPYRGQVLEEFDIDAALARRPGLLLIDELAHTNAPGSRHAKRWEDVAELLAAGIDVWATLNVQHLESLNDAVARITGVRVTETLPDRVLETADEIELIDLTPAELRERLVDGKIYRPETAQRALDGFFRAGNLNALRELALRRAAQHVDEDVRGYMRMKAIAGPWPAGERVLALVGTDPSGEAVVRHAKRLADALHAPWIALHVERLGSTADARGPLALAAGLGAEIETRAGDDVVATTLDVAAARNATQIVIGRGRPPVWRRATGRTLSAALLRQAPDYALHIVPAHAAAPRARMPRLLPQGGLPWLVATVLVGVVIGAGELLHPWLEHEALGMLFLAAVVAAASLYGLAIALYSAALGFLSWNFFFIPPVYRLTIEEPRDVIALVVFAGVASVTGLLASRVRAEGRMAQARIESLRRIGAFSRRLGEPTTEPELLAETAQQAAAIGERAVVLTANGEDLNIVASAPPTDTMDEGGWAAARWAWSRHEEAGRGTPTLPSSAWRFIPLRTVRGMLGVLGVRMQHNPGEPEVQTLLALADQAAVALERVRLAGESARLEAQAETQKLRTALLNSLSHDLRTPLTGIRGAAGILRAGWEKLPASTRGDLLASIEQDTVRMTGFLANITEMTRLESGEVAPRRERVRVADAIDAAIARVPTGSHIVAKLAPNLPDARADPALLEQVLVNVLDNAVKYSPEGSMVRVTAEAAGGMVAIAIADEGVGIAPEDLPHVFDSFFRARREDRARPGTGLGLAIARGLIEAMGGTIEAFSPRPDAPRGGAPGTIVRLRLPALP
jgi:two-component system sensor histidine kinase KdpD